MKYNTPKTMKDSIKELILNTESIDEWEEKQYWFDIWGSMNESQQERIVSILQIEKDKLEALEKRYQDQLYNLKLNNQDDFEFIKDKSKSEMLEYINL